MNSILLFSLFLAAFVAVEPMNIGGVNIVEDEARVTELVELLREHIGKLESGNWEIAEIFKVGQQVVAGLKYYYYGTFVDRHDNTMYASTVTLYYRPWDRYTELNMQDKTQIQ